MMFFRTDPFKTLRSGINGLLTDLNDQSILHEPSEIEEYKNDCLTFLRWLDNVEKFLYSNN